MRLDELSYRRSWQPLGFGPMVSLGSKAFLCLATNRRLTKAGKQPFAAAAFIFNDLRGSSIARTTADQPINGK
jgi:hypothetical protein